MSNNCLVTKLKGTVNNSSLKVYGALRFKANGRSLNGAGQVGQDLIRVYGCNGGKVGLSKGTAWANQAHTTSLGTDFSITSNNFAFYISEDAEGYLTSVYSMTQIALGNIVSINIEDLAYAPDNLIFKSYNTTSSGYATFYGNIDALSVRDNGSIIITKIEDTTAVPTIVLKGVSGSIENVAKFAVDFGDSSLGTSLWFRGSDITGNLSALASLDESVKNRIRGISTDTTNVGKISGNLSVFADFGADYLVSFDVNYISVTGNLAASLGHFVNAALFAVEHKEAEDLKNLFDALYANGKTSGSITCWMGSNKTLDGGAWVNGSTVTFNENGWTVSTPQ